MTKALLVRSSCNQKKEFMSRTIEPITAHLVRATEQPVAPTSKIKLTARWQIGPETISGNTEWKMRLEKIQSTSKRLISTAGCLIFLALPQGALKGDTVDPADEKAIQERNETFVAAFNRGDIKAMAASYAPDCDFLSAEGQRVKGRDAMEKYFAKGFAESKGLRLKHTHNSLRFLTPDVAIDDGA
jgi:SnoaL-like protein